MKNRELLFKLIKKLDSGEIGLFVGREFGNKLGIYLWDDKNGGRIKVAELPSDLGFVEQDEDVKKGCERFSKLGLGAAEIKYGLPFEYKDDWNKEFKENFYKEKGLDKCWVKDCPSKIYQKGEDYKKVKVNCKERHTRVVCLHCYNTHLSIYHPQIPKEKYNNG